MSATFSQTMRALAADSARRSNVGVVAASLLLVAWAVWFVRADVTEYEVTETARIEVSRAAHAVDSPVAGMIVGTRIALGNEVHAGDVLMEIDAEPERRRLVEQNASLAAITPEIEALQRAIDAEERVLRDDRAATTSELEEGRARQRAGELTATQAADEAARASKLAERGAITEVEGLRANTDAKTSRATTEALALGVARSEGEGRTRESKTRVEMEDLRRDIVALEGRRATTEAAIAVLVNEIDRRTIRSPIDGRIGDSAHLEAGAFVHEGDRLGAVVPRGELRVIADFAPASALGRIRPGQHARLRLDGFPWTEYGMVEATVTQVGNEPRDGHVRVELDVITNPSSRIPLEHGLPGTIEIEVARSTPASLVLRAAGKSLARPAQTGTRGTSG